MYSAVMTKKEKSARIGDLMTEYSEVRDALILLEKEMSDLSRLFYDLAPLLRSRPEAAVERIEAELPEKSDFIAAMRRVSTLRDRRDYLKNTLDQLGVKF